MTKFFIYTSLILLVIFSACTKDQLKSESVDIEFVTEDNTSELAVVDFTIDNAHGLVHEKQALLLTNNSSNATSYHWDFGNGDTSTASNPDYFYEMHGTYSVTLTITDKFDNVLETTNNITVMCLFYNEIHKDF